MRVGGLTFLVIGIVLALFGSLTLTAHTSAASKLNWIVLGAIFAGFGVLLAAVGAIFAGFGAASRARER